MSAKSQMRMTKWKLHSIFILFDRIKFIVLMISFLLQQILIGVMALDVDAIHTRRRQLSTKFRGNLS